MRPPSIRDPRSIWDVFAVLAAYVLLEYVALRVRGSLLLRQEFVVIAIIVVLWTMWAVLHILSIAERAGPGGR